MCYGITDSPRCEEGVTYCLYKTVLIFSVGLLTIFVGLLTFSVGLLTNQMTLKGN